MTLIHNIRFAGEDEADGWILVNGDTILAVGSGPAPEAETIVDGEGCLALPGVIDCHVHFREPGLTDKADIESESRAALAGGVTSVLEMPNTKPPTTTIERWQQKMDIAAAKSMVNYAFFIGATNDNIDQLKQADYTRVPGVKLFMGSSTGNMLVDDESTINRIFREVRAIVAVHAEDQQLIARNTARFTKLLHEGEEKPVYMHSLIRTSSACYNSSRKAVELARATGHRLHLCHITTHVELSLLDKGDPARKLVTSEVSPHHLMWCDDDYDTCGTRIKMNPAVKSSLDREALRRAVEDGTIDIVATDHAPHRLADKQGDALHAASGAPLVQFSLPWMLDNFSETTVQRVMCENPAKVYHIADRGRLAAGFKADITLVRSGDARVVTDSDVISKCGWTPLAGTTLTHSVQRTFVNGALAYDKGKFLAAAARPLVFGE